MNVTCADCGDEFTEKEWVEHDNSEDCVKTSPVKRVLVWIMLWFAGVLMMGLILFVILGIAGELHWISEDMMLFNCRFMGNWTCGPDTPWHGFVNLF